jgi:YebC/PmpR family DNA-binding regulatory protein
MSGHSKWASITHKKAIVDSRRDRDRSRELRELLAAAREGGGEVESNAALANAVQKARDASMPKDNIERAVAKGAGAGAVAVVGVGLDQHRHTTGAVGLIDDRLDRIAVSAGADVRHLLSKAGSSLGEPGSVAYLFEKRGVAVVDASRYSEDDLLVAIEAGALDIEADDDVLEVICEPGDLAAVRGALEEAGVEIEAAELVQRPTVRVELDEEDAKKLFRLIESLEENDDVGAVHANFEVSDEVLERAAG